MARQTLTMAIELTGADKVEVDLAKLGPAAQKAFDQIKKSADRAGNSFDGKLFGAITRVRQQLTLLQAYGGRIRSSFGTMVLAANSFGNAITASARKIGLIGAAITGAAGAIALFAKSGVETVVQADQQAKALGMSVEQFTRLNAAAGQSEISQEDFAGAMNRLNVILGKTDGEAGKAGTALDRLTDKSIKVHRGSEKLAEETDNSSDALRRLGLSVGALLKLSPEDRVLAIADAFQKFPNGVEESNIAATLFGRTLGANLIPFLNQGGAEIRRIMNDAEALGATFNSTDVIAASLADGAIDRLRLAFFGLRTQIALAFAPALEEGAKGLTEIIKKNFGSVEEFATYLGTQATQIVKDFLALLRGDDEAVVNKGLIGFRDSLNTVFTDVKSFAIGLKDAFLSVKDTVDGFIKSFNEAFGTNFTTTGVAATFIILRISGAFLVLRAGLALAAATLKLFTIGLFGLRVPPVIAATTLGVAGLIKATIDAKAKLEELSTVKLPTMAISPVIANPSTAGPALLLIYWQDIRAAVRDYFGLIGDSGESVFAGFVASASAAFENLKTALGEDIAEIQALLNTIVIDPAVFDALWDAIKNGAGDAWGVFKSKASEAIDAIKGFLTSLITKIESAISKLRSLASARSESVKGTGGGKGYARGGAVRGAGTGTSDSIFAMLSDGEFVINARAARNIGLSALQAINSGRLRGLNIGGLATSMSHGLAPRISIPAHTGESRASSLRPVNFNIDGQAFEGMMAPENTVQQIIKFATGKKLRSNGRKPGWVGA